MAQMPPWTIKGIAPEARNAATAAAAREGMTIGAWVERAIRAQVQSDRHRDKAPAVVTAPEAPPVVGVAVFDLLERAATLAHKLTGEEIPTRLRNQIMRVVHEHVRRTLPR